MSGFLREWIFGRFLPQNLKARSAKTHKQYRHAVNDFAEFLGREPTIDDLSDEVVASLANYLLAVPRSLAERTVNERVGRIKSFWNWAARKRVVQWFPTLQRIDEPEKTPRAWRREELARLFAACDRQPGMVGDVPAKRYWRTIHAWWWCTAERTSATLALRVEHLQLNECIARVPAAIRKGRKKSAVYHLWPDLIAMLWSILPPHTSPRQLVFYWPTDLVRFYHAYHRLLKGAGLDEHRVGPHRMRVSHATWRYLAGDDATRALGHSDPATTIKSYIDPSLKRPDERQLFRPWGDDGS